MSGTRSRNKGARGEREVVSLIRARSFDAVRGFASGATGGGDVATDMPDVPEVKLAERITFWPWIDQAQQNVKGTKRGWCLWIRSNHRQWTVSIDAARYLNLIEKERELDARSRREDSSW